MIRQLQETQAALQRENQQLVAQLQGYATQRPGYRMAPPSPYDGEEGSVNGFLTRVKAYLLYHHDTIVTEPDKVLYASGFLKRKAQNWFKPILKDYINNNIKD